MPELVRGRVPELELELEQVPAQERELAPEPELSSPGWTKSNPWARWTCRWFERDGGVLLLLRPRPQLSEQLRPRQQLSGQLLVVQ